MAGMSDYKNFSIVQQESPYPSYVYPNVPSFGDVRGVEGHGSYDQLPTTPSTLRYYENQGIPLPSSSSSPGQFYNRGDLSLSLNREVAISSSRDSTPDDPNIRKYADKGVGIISIVADNIISHPFLVVRRQCQVHVQSRRYHMSPFTILYPVFNICQRQGCGVLWKGLGSSLLVRGMTMFVEDLTCKLTYLPNEITRHSSMKSVCQHILLKAISLAVITPFYSASVVETAQSEVASECSGILDVFREGIWRILSWPSTGRMVPLHVLVIPTVTHGLLSYLIYTGIKSISHATLRRVRESKERKQGALSKDSSVSYYAEMTASLIGHATADILLFPLETILHRLHIQGTRTIIDSLDCGVEVTPVITSFEGVIHCCRTTIEEEGFSGLYKGFGALVLQYGLQILLIRCVKIVIEKSPFGFTPLIPSIEERSSTVSIQAIATQSEPLIQTRSIETPNIRPASRQYSRSFTPTGGGSIASTEVDIPFEPRSRVRFTNYNIDT